MLPYLSVVVSFQTKYQQASKPSLGGFVFRSNLNITIEKRCFTTESPKIQLNTFNSLWLLLVGFRHQFSTIFK
jgi:hypothetical protein